MNQISLNSSMRSNLLSLQQTQALQDMTQLRLSTGLKVNSAIDNPSNYYTASSLSNRAKDLSSLLDAMSQGIQTIKAASETLTAATKFLDQAKAVAVKASESGMDIIAKVKTEDELLAAIASSKTGYIIIENNISLTNKKLTLNNGQNLVGANYFDNNKAQTTLTFNYDNFSDNAIEAGNNSIIANLNIESNNAFLGYDSGFTNKEFAVIKLNNVENVSLSNLNFNTDTSGYSQVPARGYFAIYSTKSSYKISENLNINAVGENNRFILTDKSSTLNINSAQINLYNMDNGSIGLQSYSDSIVNINGNSRINIKSNSVGLYCHQRGTININNNSEVNVSNASLASGNLQESQANKIILNDKAKLNILGIYQASSVHFIVNSKDAVLNLGTTYSLSEFIDVYFSAVNGAKIYTKTGLFTCTAAGGVENILTYATSDLPAAHFSKDSSKPATLPSDAKDRFDNFEDYIKANSAYTSQDSIKPMQNSSQYANILSQYNQLMNDASYKGINLLQSQNLKVNFNEEHTSQIAINGVDASTKGLGLNEIKWESYIDITNSVNDLENAITKLRSFSAEFGNYYSVVNSRIDFTDNLINVLTEGSDKLTLADMNESSANMLALQTRQQLAINALSLANQASQSVLKLF